MRALPEDFEAGQPAAALAEGWGFHVENAEYAPVGGGSYHWVVRDADGQRHFVTVDDLDRKAWLGDTRDEVFDGLRRAFDTAAALRAWGLDFVVAPIPTSRGESLLRAGPRHTIALFPCVEGEAGRFGHYETADERRAVVRLLAELHAATPVVARVARRMDLDVPGRRHVEAALRHVDRPWSGGPLSEAARALVAAGASDVAELLALADRLREEIARRGAEWVASHGEPHAANVMRTAGGLLLLDWDTVALAPPERDLWMVVEEAGDDVAAAYARATGHEPDSAALSFYRLSWDLGDLSEYLVVLRGPHQDTADTRQALQGVKNCVATRAKWASLLAL
jgi:spectinomycin phosphotransferase